MNRVIDMKLKEGTSQYEYLVVLWNSSGRVPEMQIDGKMLSPGNLEFSG